MNSWELLWTIVFPVNPHRRENREKANTNKNTQTKHKTSKQNPGPSDFFSWWPFCVPSILQSCQFFCLPNSLSDQLLPTSSSSPHYFTFYLLQWTVPWSSWLVFCVLLQISLPGDLFLSWHLLSSWQVGEGGTLCRTNSYAESPSRHSWVSHPRAPGHLAALLPTPDTHI